MRAAAYLRVSSKAQTLDMQRDAIARAARARGDRITTWYSEKQSAKTIARPVLTSLRQDARAGHVRRLYVFRLDRLTRSGIRDTFEVVAEFRTAGCELMTVSDGFDLSGPAAEVVLAVMAWASKMERLAINERIAAARVRLEAAGRAWGRPPVLSPKERKTVLNLHRDGRPVRSIAQAVGASRSAVYRAIVASRKDAPVSASGSPRQQRVRLAPVRK